MRVSAAMSVSVSPGALAWRRFRAHRLALASAALLILLTLLALGAPWFAAWRGVDGEAVDLMLR
ncbi:MAG TPA: peptide ABC transporter permease, partial [Kaistia sp.]|nr:peptide ABC transporter permease [Kaistia sp.]